MKRFTWRRMLPLFAGTLIATLAITIPLILNTIRSDSHEQILQILDQQNREAAYHFTLLSADDQDLFINSTGTSTSIAAPMLSGGGRELILNTRYYRLEDLQAVGSSVLDLPEVQAVLKGSSGKAVRSHPQKNVETIAAALRLELTGTVLIVHSLVTENFIPLTGLAILTTVSLSLLLTVALLFIITITVIRGEASQLSQITNILNEYGIGYLGNRIPPGKRSLLSPLVEQVNLTGAQMEHRLEKLGKNFQEMQSILDNLNEGVLLVDPGERIRRVNSAALKLFSVHTMPELCIGRTSAEVFRSGELNSAVDQFCRLQEQGSRIINYRQIQDGRLLHISITAFPIDTPANPDRRTLFVLRDISELIRLEQIRRDFVSNVSHELKTPITTIQGFSETLLDGALEDPEHAREFLAIIRKQSNRMENIIRDLLSLSRLEQDDTEIVFSRYMLSELLMETVEIVTPAANARKTQLHVDCPQELEVQLNGFLMEQCIINLVENGVKYGNQGGNVWIQANYDGKILKLLIEDDGPGIAQRDIPRLFERFYRVDTGRSRAMGGTGLGLAIVKHIVQAHRGSINCASIPGKGTVFTIEIPQPIPTQDSIPTIN